jgi:hypothetical protein
MVLIATDTYRLRKRDRTTNDTIITASIARAVARVEAVLDGRMLESSARTEKLRVSGREVWPHAFPITAVTSPAGAVISPGEMSLWYVIPDALSIPPTMIFDLQDPPEGWWEYATVDYTGGYSESTLPEPLKDALLDLAYVFVREAVTFDDADDGIPPGATSISLGDASVTFDRGQNPLDQLVPGLYDRVRPYRYVDTVRS